ncbi:hypothetical protein PT286_03100 [Neisseriaceae bacterium ESL0693]|nr:hypothetical protein [Neisseriaceae bacterium ESL0693]
MPVYTVFTKIESNVPVDKLRYDISVYRWDKESRKAYFLLLPVYRESLQADYSTKKHQTVDTNDPPETVYLVRIELYRYSGYDGQPVSGNPFVRLFSLKDIINGRIYAPFKKGFAYYYETPAKPKSILEGGNTVLLRISQPERQFIARKYPVGDSNDPFEKERFDSYNKHRNDYSIKNHSYTGYKTPPTYFAPDESSYPYQGDTSLCGPAAFFFCLLIDRPDVYQQAAHELWQYGETRINDLIIKPGNSCKHPSGPFYKYAQDGVTIIKRLISGLDWVTLASLRDSSNHMMAYDEVSDQVAGISPPWDINRWFTEAGYKKIFDNIRYRRHSNFKEIEELNHYARQGYRVVSLISANMLDSIKEEAIIPTKTHWIVWMGPVEIAVNGEVSLNLFSWGQIYNQIKPQKDIDYFLKHTFGGMVFEPLK